VNTERRIVANFFVSLDGVVESPDRWHFEYFDAEMGAVIADGIDNADALLMGGTLYREWAAYWPANAEEDFGGFMNGIPKYVVSRTLERTDWANATLLREYPATRLRELKAQPGRDIAMSGSATLMRWLLAEGLLDELNLLVHPVVVGSGARLFPTGTEKAPLELTGSRVFGSGVVYLSYRPAGARRREANDLAAALGEPSRA
jgi:dihydrofolate reductase